MKSAELDGKQARRERVPQASETVALRRAA